MIVWEKLTSFWRETAVLWLSQSFQKFTNVLLPTAP
jgi:hypothetical protein